MASANEGERYFFSLVTLESKEKEKRKENALPSTSVFLSAYACVSTDLCNCISESSTCACVSFQSFQSILCFTNYFVNPCRPLQQRGTFVKATNHYTLGAFSPLLVLLQLTRLDFPGRKQLHGIYVIFKVFLTILGFIFFLLCLCSNALLSFSTFSFEEKSNL